jgi:hypothetical protein
VNGFAPFGRFSRRTRVTFGMTSPAFSTAIVSPTRTSLRERSSMLWSVARRTVEPARRTGVNSATGVRTPVRPTWTGIAVTTVVASSGGYL